MFSKRILSSLLAGATLLATHSVVMADGSPYVGIQGGYGNTNWDNIEPLGFSTSERHGGIAARVFAGYEFYSYFAGELGYTYFSPTKIKNFGDIDTYALDVLGKFQTRFSNGVGVYAKAGPGYLHSTSVPGIADDVGHFDLVYGLGVDYEIAPNLLADISWTRHNGDGKVKLGDEYQPDADLYAVGLIYKFNATM